MKTCTKCHQDKDETEFYADTQYKGGFRSDCKSCISKHRKEYREANLEHWKDLRLKGDYKISLEEYNNLLKLQNNVCASCGEPEAIMQNGKVKALSVDHDHKTGTVRGLLCHACNTSLGLLKNDIDRCYLLIKYILTFI